LLCFRSTIYAIEQCTELKGYYTTLDKSCYYNGSQLITDCGYFMNRECYLYLDSSYTASTCANIGGFFRASDAKGKLGNFCYYNQFNCTFYHVNNQCYKFKTSVNRSQCNSSQEHYQHGHCYHDCPHNKFLFNGQCYDSRSAQYTQADCQAVGGVYAYNYCYIDKCNYSPVNDHCYKKNSTSFTNATCQNIGGYYAVDTSFPYNRYCYYNSFNCRYQPVNGQCYSRSSNHSQSACRTIPDSYFDVSNNVCYYYCTEMPKLRQCFVANDPSLTRETCANIGGVYSNRTCYYIASYCPKYKPGNGQCYAKVSAAFTCDTCANIGGLYQNRSCYYHQYKCNSTYIVDGQCYSTRSNGYSRSWCENKGGLYRDFYCYYEAGKCRGAYYRGCRCFEYYSTTNTPETCANFNGYYEINTRKCFYNLSSCPYYKKNQQCYRYRNANLSRITCRIIGGYYTYERGPSGRYGYACYYNLVNCTNWFKDQCYPYFSSTYNEGSCVSVRGYYSQEDQGCYYYSSRCPSYSMGGQCYDRSYSGWSRAQCDEANGYYTSRCYVNRFYCASVHYSTRKCYSYTSGTYDCSSCRLLDGFMFSGRCYYKIRNCSEPMFLAGNGQCYENRTTVRTAADCHSRSGNAFYSERNNQCYFSVGECSVGYYVNCQCYNYKIAIYTAGSCKNFGGYYSNGMCYYNSSHCPSNYHSINAQCYRQSRLVTLSTCINIGGYYDNSTMSSTTVTCYYNIFNCSSGFTVDGRYCFTNRSATYSRPTCKNIGGIYGYIYSGTQYRSAGSYIYPWRTYYCLYNTFNCVA